MQRTLYNLLFSISLAAAVVAFAGCGFDPTAAEYDQTRYDEIQKTNCHDVASLGSSSLASENPDDKETVLARCLAMKALTFEEYVVAADYARKYGEWDIDKALGRK